MGQAAGGASFLRETLTIGLFVIELLAGERDGFDGNDAVNLGIERAVHHSHCAATDFGVNAIASQRLMDCGFHGRA